MRTGDLELVTLQAIAGIVIDELFCIDSEMTDPFTGTDPQVITLTRLDSHNRIAGKAIGSGVVLPLTSGQVQPAQPSGCSGPYYTFLFIQVNSMDGIAQDRVRIFWFVQMVGVCVSFRVK